MNKSLIFFIGFVLLLLSWRNQDIDVKPNIILINIDDLGWKDLGFMGSDYYNTPNIDKLSQLGMQFSNGYAAAANCAPSRASLMTGKWPTHHGIYTVGSSKRGKSKDRLIIPTPNKTTLAQDETTLAQILNKDGYFTIHAGKWHLSDSPISFGFDLNIGGGHNGHPKSYYPPYKNVGINGDKYLTDQIMEKAIESVDSVNEPFFLYYAPYAVHTPIQPIDSLLPNYENEQSEIGQNNMGYATMIENLDRNIGLLIQNLNERRLFKNALIIFTSDNGGLFGITNQHPLRAGKGSYYEGGIREPFFFVWQDKIRAKSKSNIPITNLDILPTILACTGIEMNNDEYDGVNLLPILLDNKSELDRPLFWHFPIYLQAYKNHNSENRDSLFRTRPGSVIRFGKWKLHYYFEQNEIELYNLDDDIGEKNDLSKIETIKKKELLMLLQNWWKETNAPIPKERNPDYVE